MPDSDGFTERLKTLMKERGINQVKLCELTGLSSAQANYLAKGKTKDPKISTACKIALALDVSLDYLAGLIDEPRPIQRGADGLPVMSETEERLLGLYRDANAQGQSTIMGVAQLQQGVDGSSNPGQSASPGGRSA